MTGKIEKQAIAVSRTRERKGFTLVEMLVVLAVIGIVAGFSFLTWNSNLVTFENYAVRSDIWEDSNAIVQRMSFDARRANELNSDVPEGGKVATYLDRFDNEVARFQVFADNTFQVTYNAGQDWEVLSPYVDFDNSFIREEGRGLILDLILADQVFQHRVETAANTQIYPRN